eukprot:COSAG05_NODE_1331_length_5154_cov_14.769733_2_plen_192_part_00
MYDNTRILYVNCAHCRRVLRACALTYVSRSPMFDLTFALMCCGLAGRRRSWRRRSGKSARPSCAGSCGCGAPGPSLVTSCAPLECVHRNVYFCMTHRLFLVCACAAIRGNTRRTNCFQAINTKIPGTEHRNPRPFGCFCVCGRVLIYHIQVSTLYIIYNIIINNNLGSALLYRTTVCSAGCIRHPCPSEVE